jgi:hypothetical protein
LSNEINLLFVNREALSESYRLKAEKISFDGGGVFGQGSQSVGAREVQTFQARVGLCGGLQTLTHGSKSEATQG